jgi:hypothetical protein
VTRTDPLRNAAIVSALEQALAGRSQAELHAQLARAGGLPGPRPNWGLAWAVARAVADAGSRANTVVADLVAMNDRRAPARSALEFLPLVGAFCLASRALAKPALGPELDRLLSMADDPRHLVREGIALALIEIGSERSEELVASLELWTKAYLPAAVALAALAARPWVDRLRSPDDVIARFDEAFSLAENAGRADRRSQGYRTLVETLSDAPSRVMHRFPGPMLAWLESRANTADVQLREALQVLIDGARSRGLGSLEGVRAGLEASAPPRRDPKTYVGPTRRRGSRK